MRSCVSAIKEESPHQELNCPAPWFWTNYCSELWANKFLLFKAPSQWYFVLAAQADQYTLCRALDPKTLCGHLRSGDADWITSEEWALCLPRLETGLNGLSHGFFPLSLKLVSAQVSKRMQLEVGSSFLAEGWVSERRNVAYLSLPVTKKGQKKDSQKREPKEENSCIGYLFIWLVQVI